MWVWEGRHLGKLQASALPGAESIGSCELLDIAVEIELGVYARAIRTQLLTNLSSA